MEKEREKKKEKAKEKEKETEREKEKGKGKGRGKEKEKKNEKEKGSPHTLAGSCLSSSHSKAPSPPPRIKTWNQKIFTTPCPDLPACP